MTNNVKELKLPAFLKPALKVIAVILFWVFVPGIMLGVVILGKRLSSKVENSEMKTSARAGWWAGLILFVFFFIYQIPRFRLPTSLVEPSIELSYIGALCGAFVGFIILFALRALIESRAIGLITMLLSFSGTSALYSYFFIRMHNNILMSSSLGVAFGALLYVVLFPKKMHELLGRNDHIPTDGGDGK